ncbi:MAG: tetratricopeptide repeat protein [Planctomycetes bacterium]|nr:tetratricopeptide repeat protein [Planctomycetota bacterium]
MLARRFIRRVPALSALLAFALLLNRCGPDAAPADPSDGNGVTPAATWRPNVLLVTLDTMRADALGCYGAAHGWTPTLDAFAARGVRFAMARATAPITLPSHASIFTGTYPFQHGVRDNGTFVLGEGATTLAERLKASGWQTGAMTAAFVVDSAFGLAQGFDRYDDVGDVQLATGGEGEDRPASAVVDRALDWLRSVDRARPFFLWVHLFDAHFPYAAPADLMAAHPYADDPSRKGNARDKQRHLYHLEVANVDRQLARLFAGLAPFGGAEQTLIAVIGDHGEGLGEHGESSHAVYVYDSTLRVPLLLAHARLPTGRVIDEPVSTVDLAPTLLDLLGLPHDGTAGLPLAPLWQERPFASARTLYFENCATWFTSGWAPLYGIVQGGKKAIVGPQTRVFDVMKDPGEKRDLADRTPDLVETARTTLSNYADLTLAATRHTPDSAELAALNRLGYVQSAASSGRESLAPPGWQPEGVLTPEQGQENMRRFSQANQIWRQGQKLEAIEQLLALTREEPQNSHYAEIAAALLHELGRTVEALPLAERAVDLAPNTGNCSTLAACLLALGRRDDALRTMAETVDRFPKIAAPRIHYASALLDAGRREEAKATLAPLLAELPADSPIRSQVQALLTRADGP